MSAFQIVPDPAAPLYVPLSWWHIFLSRVLPSFFPRPRFIWAGADNTLVCHPDNIAVLKRWLDQHGHTYTQSAARLQQVTS